VTEPPTVCLGTGSPVHVTSTSVMFAVPTVPAPLDTVQVWLEGWLDTVTE